MDPAQEHEWQTGPGHGAVQALSNGQIDGIVVDLYSAFYMRDVQLADAGGVIVGQFPIGEEAEQFGFSFEKGSPLVDCVNEALASMRADGTLEAIYQEWLADKASAPVISG